MLNIRYYRVKYFFFIVFKSLFLNFYLVSDFMESKIYVEFLVVRMKWYVEGKWGYIVEGKGKRVGFV